MSSYFDMVNKFNQESNDKAQHAADVGRVAIEQKAADLSELHSQLLEKYNTGSEALSGLGLAYGSARKVYKKIKTKGKDTDADPAKPDANTTDTNTAPTDTSVADPAAAPAAADPAAAIPASSTSAAADSATAAADSAAAAAAPTAATADAGAAAVPASSEAQTILTQEGSDWDAIAAGDYSSLPGGGGAAAAPAAAAAPDVAPAAAPTPAPAPDAAPTPPAAPDPAAPLAETTAEEAGSGVLDFLGPAGLATGAVIGLVDLFKGIFDKVPTAADITAKAPIVSGGGSIDASSLGTAASTVGATQV